MDIEQFRANFPEFRDTVRYPSSQILFWSAIAEAQVNERAWGSAMDFGVNLYVAHEITMASQNVQVGATGNAPGSQSGPVNSKSVGGGNISFDSTQATEKDAGWWNLTQYGKQFIRLARMYGSGGIQLGVGSWCGGQRRW